MVLGKFTVNYTDNSLKNRHFWYFVEHTYPETNDLKSSILRDLSGTQIIRFIIHSMYKGGSLDFVAIWGRSYGVIHGSISSDVRIFLFHCSFKNPVDCFSKLVVKIHLYP